MVNNGIKEQSTDNILKRTGIRIQEITLLSSDEYETYKANIKPIKDSWWLRTPGNSSDRVSCIDCNGEIRTDVNVYDKVCLRPVLIIPNLHDTGLKIGASFKLREHTEYYTWTVISDKMALCDSFIKKIKFADTYSSDLKAANIFKTSEAKRELKNWARDYNLKCTAAKTVSPEELEIEKVTLLSASEYWRYSENIEPIDTRWWLRTSGSESNAYAAYVDLDKNVDARGHYLWVTLPIRPSLVVRNLRALNLTAGDVFEMAGYTWTVISEKIVLCDFAVGKSAFRQDGVGIYKESDVSKWLDKWAKDNDIRCTENKAEKLSNRRTGNKAEEPSNIWDPYIFVPAFLMTAALRFVGFSFITSLLICIGVFTITRLIVTDRIKYQQKEIPGKDRENADRQPAETDCTPVQPTETDNADISSVKAGAAYAKRIRETGAHIPNTQVRRELDTMGDILDSIFAEAQKNPSCIKKLDTLISYYLPTIVKLLDVYLDMEQFPTKSEFIKQSQKDIETSLRKYNEAFSVLLIELYKEKVKDISTDMTAMDNLMLQQGLLPDALDLIRQQELERMSEPAECHSGQA